MSLTLVQLRHALLVAQCGSFSEAARRSNASQPTVSASVSDLELTLGKPLFSRTTRRLELTAFGRALLPRIGDAVAAAGIVSTEARALIDPERKLLRIAYTPLIDIRRITALCAPYRLSHPQVEVIFKECYADDVEQRLDAEQIDIVCGPAIQRRSARTRCPLFEDPLHYIPPFGAAKNLAPQVSLDVIATQTLLLTVGTCGLAPVVEGMFAKAGLDVVQYAGRAISHASLQEWAELGLGAAILPASRIRGDLSRFPQIMHRGKPQKLSHEAVWLTSSSTSRHLKPFFRLLPKIARSLAQGSGMAVV